LADLFEIKSAIPTSSLDAAGNLVEIVEATGVTIPHGVSFVVRVPKAPGWRDALLAEATREAAEFESLFGV